MGKLAIGKLACIVFMFCTVSGVAAFAQTFTSLARFDRSDGLHPSSVVEGLDGSLYGTTAGGGNRLGGTIFDIAVGSGITELHSFCVQEFCRDGGYPQAGLDLAMDGNFYGTTVGGGLCCGTIFKMDAAGTYTDLYHFCALPNCADGEKPYAGLVQGTDGNFYGTTLSGGANGSGTVFKVTAKAELTTLYSFCSQTRCIDGSSPPSALVQATDGNFYGTTTYGGSNDSGTVFRITPAGVETVLYSFCSQSNCADGSFVQSALIQAANGNFYGTTPNGGANTNDDICPSGCGTIFEITPAGQLTTLYNFCSQSDCTDGAASLAGLVQATDGNLYGTASDGGTYDNGTVFQVTPAGKLTTLHNFCAQLNPESNCSDGSLPVASLIQATDGSLYGTTERGGLGRAGNCYHGCGTIFSVSMGLSPFIETIRASGEVRGNVTILGNNLTGTTSVTFNGTAAAFTVVSNTEITTTVPSGATTGLVEVVTPSGTLSSNVPFRVEP
jgi:uncharacterized repeat protein (TIGR03803 family)